MKFPNLEAGKPTRLSHEKICLLAFLMYFLRDRLMLSCQCGLPYMDTKEDKFAERISALKGVINIFVEGCLEQNS